MQLTQRTVWTIERNLNSELSLANLADVAEVSNCHLARAFSQATGMTVMRYVRGRRLSEAAKKLSLGESNILGLALEAGYGSHEAFTRAFREMFAATPEAVRDQGVFSDLPLLKPLTITSDSILNQQSVHYEDVAKRQFIGLEQRHPLRDLSGIPNQWQQLMAYYSAINSKLDPIPWGLSRIDHDDAALIYSAAVMVNPSSSVPEGLVRYTLPQMRYAVFNHDAHVSAVSTSIASILNSWKPDLGWRIADSLYLEQHCETFDTRTGFDGVNLWLPIMPFNTEISKENPPSCS
jgi:AraC family transcriptional regulator